MDRYLGQALRQPSLPSQALGLFTEALSRRTAQRIVDRVSSGLEHSISVAAPSGHVLASSDARLVGVHAAIAVAAIAGGDLVKDEHQQPGGLSVPLVYADRIVGAIIIDDTSQHAHDIARVAKTLAELIIHQTTVLDHLPQQAWARDTFLSDLVHHRLDGAQDVPAQAAAILHIDPHAPRVVVAVDLRKLIDRLAAQEAPATALLQIAHQFRVEQIQQQLIEVARCIFLPSAADIFGFVDGRVLIVLAPIDPAAPEPRRRQLVDDTQRFLDQLESQSCGTASAGIGRSYGGWQETARSFDEARYALDTGAALFGPGRVYLVDALGAASFVGNADPALKRDLARHLLGSLDSEHDLRTTLETFLRSNLSPSVTAAALHIHRHTLTYRLDKIARLTGCDPREFEAAVRFYVALLTERLHGYCS
jgi:carbohydrate diacid regulator